VGVPGRPWALPSAPPTSDVPPAARHPAPVRRLRPQSRPPLGAHQSRADAAASSSPFLRYVRSLYPERQRLAIILDNFSPHLTTKTDTRVGDYAAAHNIELVYVPFNARLAGPGRGAIHRLRYFALDGTDHATHREQGRAIRRYIAWCNHNPHDRRLRKVVDRANVA
jgi:hypothetical protein